MQLYVTPLIDGTTHCKWDSVIPFDDMWERLNKIIKPNGAIMLFGSEPFSSALRMSNIKNYRFDYYWEKSKAGLFLQSSVRPMKKIECISVFSNAQCNPAVEKNKRMKYYPQGIIENGLKKISRKKASDNYNGKVFKRAGETYMSYRNYPDDILRFKNIYGKGTLHPTQKPVSLMEYLIKTYTNEGELVLDFTCGSGSTLVACRNTGRRGIGIDNGTCERKGDLYGKSWVEITQMRLDNKI